MPYVAKGARVKRARLRDGSDVAVEPHFSAKRGVLRSHVICPSVCPFLFPSVCDVGGLWSHRLDFLENNFTVC